MTQTDWVNSIAAPKYVPVCKRRAVGLGASTNGTNTFVLMDAPC